MQRQNSASAAVVVFRSVTERMVATTQSWNHLDLEPLLQPSTRHQVDLGPSTARLACHGLFVSALIGAARLAAPHS